MDVPAAEKCKGQILHISKTLQDLLAVQISPRQVRYTDAEEEISVVSYLHPMQQIALSGLRNVRGKKRACTVGVSVGVEETAGAKRCG